MQVGGGLTMELMMKIKTLNDIVDSYDLLFVDMWGVVYDGVHALTPAIQVLNELHHQNKTMMFVSNNPRPQSVARKTLDQIGVNSNIPIVTSGDVTRDLIREKHSGHNVFHIGAETNQDILKNMPVTEVSSLHEADFVLLSPFMDEVDDCTVFDEMLIEIAGLELPVYCPNPDVYAPHHGTLRKTAGFFAERLERFGGTVIRIGKPYANIFEYVLEQYGQPIAKDKILMIGDGMETDIKGGIDFGIDTLFVEDGISKLISKDYDFSSKFRIDHLQ